MFIFDFSQVPDRIRQYRKEAGLSQRELAEKCGLTRDAIASYESGRADPPNEKIEKIALALNRNFSDFVIVVNDSYSDDFLLFGALLDRAAYKLFNSDGSVFTMPDSGKIEENIFFLVVGRGQRFLIGSDAIKKIVSQVIHFFNFSFDEVLKDGEKDKYKDQE